MEHTTIHSFVVDKWKRHGRVYKLTIRRKNKINNPVFSIKVDPPIPFINFRTPEWVKDFVDRMNKGEVKLK